MSSKKAAAESEPKQPPIWVEVTVQGLLVKMKVDTGVAFSVMDESEFVGRFPNVVVEPSNITVRGYFGQLSPVVGKAMVTATFGGTTATVPLQLQSTPWSKLGKAFGMPVKQLVSVHSVSSVNNMVGKFQSLFSERLGTMQGMKVNLSVPE